MGDQLTASQPAHLSLTLDALARLLAALREDGYQLMGPTVRDGAIVHAQIGGVEDLPKGWTETQEAGTYRLVRREDEALFGYSVGPQSWKQMFFARLRLFTVRRTDAGLSMQPEDAPAPRLALIGARSCDIHAIEVQDRDLSAWAAGRSRLRAAATGHVHRGGQLRPGWRDVLLRVHGDRAQSHIRLRHRADRTPRSASLSRPAGIGARRGIAPAGGGRRRALRRRRSGRADRGGHGSVDGPASGNTRHQVAAVPDLEHPRWDDVADRCLSCTNCTLVCPTCFCATIEDTSDLAGTTAERWRRWDSCFTPDHSYLHGGSVRASTRARYRQWLTHKLASWIDQFGTSGCVGCGRCITWCPVGIDITQEVSAIRATDGARREGTEA